MHSLRTVVASFSLLLLALPLPGALASPTLLPRLHAPSEFRHEHHTHSPAPTRDFSPPGPERLRRNPVGDCNVAGQHCCNSTVSHSSESGAALSSLMGLSTLPDSSLLMGFDCSPLVPTLANGGTCTGTMVCCEGNQEYNGLINIGCSPLEM